MDVALAPPAGRRRFAVLLLALALGTSLVFAALRSSAPAQAVTDAYCVGVSISGFDHCDAPARHSLTSNEAFNYYGSATTVCAGATLNGSFFGSYACGSFGYAQHCYDGTNLLVGRIHNGQSATQTMSGQYKYSAAC
jgi:hypothetical protein